MKIIISGLTAAGKTTHGRLIAHAFDLPYFSASEVMVDLLGTTGSWTPSMDALRRDRDIDAEVDRRIVRLFEEQPRGVFDAWALAWLTSLPAVRIWLESDLASRIRKAAVSELRRGRQPDASSIADLVASKDAFSRSQFRRLYSFDLFFDREVFDLIIDNSQYIQKATIAASDRGIMEFNGIFGQAVTPFLAL